jgi:hypothetical protein
MRVGDFALVVTEGEKASHFFKAGSQVEVKGKHYVAGIHLPVFLGVDKETNEDILQLLQPEDYILLNQPDLEL